MKLLASLLPALALAEVNDFGKLSCNEFIHPCRPWDRVFGTDPVHESRIVIPCGECVLMNFDGDTLELKDGIDIHGRLWFPLGFGTGLTITTPFIVVQGELEMSSTRKSVNGEFDYRFVMTGTDDVFINPIDSNTGACTGEECNVGFKAIAVAGGQVNIRGIHPECPSWVKLYDVVGNATTASAIIVDESVGEYWAPGAEILVTSHTTEWDAHQERRISSVETADGPYVALYLDHPIVRPTTILDDENFAVEVALLSRNIVFEGATDGDPLHGGQLVVYHTPELQQDLYGVEIVNFGQQGILGRYPVHFHFCGDSSNSTVRRNVIRQSNQRCIVIHGTNKILIEETVCYDTKGHAYVTEDGYETYNNFTRNLGAKTAAPQRLIPNIGTNGYETDRAPSTFWITNPQNIFVENVAAGSQDSGFWFELKVRGDRAHLYPGLDPRSSSTILFKDNVAHSNRKIGFRAYPTGYRPRYGAVIEGFKGYRNLKGAFFHLSKNILITESLFADNLFSGLEIDRADNMDVNGTTIIGSSDIYRHQEETLGLTKLCFGPNLYGLEYHGWKNDAAIDGSLITNIEFEGFVDTGCSDAAAIWVDRRNQNPLFDMYTTFSGLRFEKGAKKLDMCPAVMEGFMPFFTDADGSLSPNDEKLETSSTLVGEVPAMMLFVDPLKCQAVPESCYSYCKDTCFRGIRYSVDPSVSKDYLLKVCNKENPTTCAFFPGYFRGRDELVNTRFQMFNAYLPTGQYTAVFVDQDGLEVWPNHAMVDYQDDEVCPTALQYGDVELLEPDIADDQCRELIVNGNFTDFVFSPWPWRHKFTGVKIARGRGWDRTNALTSDRIHTSTTLSQSLDSRCMIEGQQYALVIRLKLLDDYHQGYECRPNHEPCPKAGLEGTFGRYLVAYWDMSRRDKQGFQTLQGNVTIAESMAAAEHVQLYVRANKNMRMYLDSVSMHLIDESDYVWDYDDEP